MNCIKDSCLRGRLKLVHLPCDYCNSVGPSADLFEVALECDEVLDAHFEPTHLDPSVTIHDWPPAGLNLQDTIHRLNVIPDGAMDDLVENLQTLWFDRDTMQSKYFPENDDENPWFRMRSDLGESLSAGWRRMARSLQHEVRYLNPEAISFLDNVLDDIHSTRTEDDHLVIVDAGAGTKLERLYRARVFQTEAPLIEALSHPAGLLGTPAAGMSPAGRMNAKGQPTFYGATNVEVAIAEVRPPVGSWVATAGFDITRKIKLLDLRILDKVQLDPALSLFEPLSIEKAQRRDFLRTLSSRLIQPVMPDLQEQNYLVTQVIADYLATHKHGPIDGIIYPSAQKKGREEVTGCNVALFPRASQVDGAFGQPLGQVELWEHEEDGPGRYLSPSVWEYKDTDSKASKAFASRFNEIVHRPPTLALVRGEIKVHEVEGVAFTTWPHTVTFHPQ